MLKQNEYDKIMKVIRSCKTYDHLITTYKWLDNIMEKMSPSQLVDFFTEIKYIQNRIVWGIE